MAYRCLILLGPGQVYRNLLSLGAGKHERLTVGMTGGPILSPNRLAAVPDCMIFAPDLGFDTLIVPDGHGIFDNRVVTTHWMDVPCRAISESTH
jgi:hypothetical protein